MTLSTVALTWGKTSSIRFQNSQRLSPHSTSEDNFKLHSKFISHNKETNIDFFLLIDYQELFIKDSGLQFGIQKNCK